MNGTNLGLKFVLLTSRDIASQHGLGRNKENVSEEDYTIYLRVCRNSDLTPQTEPGLVLTLS